MLVGHFHGNLLNLTEFNSIFRGHFSIGIEDSYGSL